MRKFLVAVTIAASVVGCNGSALLSGGKGAASCPKPQGEEIEVHAPKQKVVVEVPRPAAPQAQAEAAPPVAPPAPQPPPITAQATTRIRERTAFGLMFDTIRIPMPILRPVAMARPAEMTMTLPVASSAMVPMMPVGLPGQGAGGSLSINGSMNGQLLASLLGQGGVSQEQLSLVMQLMASGQLTQQQLTAIIQALSTGRGAGGGTPPANPPQPPAQGGGQGMAVPPPAGGAFIPNAAANVGGLSVVPLGAPVGSSAVLLERLQYAEQKLQQLEQLQKRQPQPGVGLER